MYLLNVLTWLAGWSHVMSLTCDRGGLLLLSGDEYACVGLSVCFVGDLCRSVCFFFFFSSRRRHTRCGRDWSSDVCSSDLAESTYRNLADLVAYAKANPGAVTVGTSGHGSSGHMAMLLFERVAGVELNHVQIGRASCRERG